MDISIVTLIFPAFIAGILTFLAPCTLPLLPAYLGFVSGVSFSDLADPEKARVGRGKVVKNGIFYVLGFSAVFILLGSLFSLGGIALAPYRLWLARVGGVFVIVFGLFMMNVLKFPALAVERRLPVGRFLKPGNPVSSFLFGSAFALGWTPCVGPVLGTVLLLASTSGTVAHGALLLAVFSLGLAIPFLFVAATVEWSSRYLAKAGAYLQAASVIGGLFLIALGVLLVTDRFNLWIAYAYRLFNFIEYDRLLDYL